jgi:hypothetical protein
MIILMIITIAMMSIMRRMMNDDEADDDDGDDDGADADGDDGDGDDAGREGGARFDVDPRTKGRELF